MKNILVFLPFICWTAVAKAQAVNPDIIPTNTKAAFNQRFGTASDWIWNVSGENGYSVVFKYENSRHYAEVKSSGEISLLKYEIKETDLPFYIQDVLKTEYPNHQIHEIDKIEKNDLIQYEVELEGYPDYIILFDPLGMVVEKKVD
ncbi:MAG TPA: PepSY-like domain-containing protein [Sphingobacteriaceae bacterium]